MKKVLIIAASMYIHTAWAQKNDQLQFKDEHAVITRTTEHVNYYFNKGELKATTSVSTEILMLTDKAPAMYNTFVVHHGNFSKLTEVEAATLVPTSGSGYKKVKAKEFKSSKATANGVFYDDAQQTQITFTGLVKDAKTSVSYELAHDDIHFMPSFYFQSYLPAAVCEYKVTVPKSVRLKWQLYGHDTDKVEFSTETSRNEITYTWRALNIAKYKTYDLSPGVAYYLPHIITHVESYIKPRTDDSIRVFGNLDDLYRFYYPFIRDVNRNVPSDIEQLVATLTKDATTEKEKAVQIYKYVQQYIRYVAFEDGMGGFIPREASLVCNRKYGDCKDMSNLLVTMCRAAGLKAYHTWIGTREKPYSYKSSPFPMTDNHMICTVNIDGEWIILDGTDSQIPFGIPPHNIQGKEALIGINKDEYKLIVVPTADAGKNLTADSSFIKLSGKDISGTINMHISGYRAWDLHQIMLYYNAREKENLVKSFMARGSNKYFQKTYSYKTAEHEEKDALFTAEFEVKDYVQKAGKEYYINMNLLRPYENYYIDLKDRTVPIEFDYKNVIREVVVMDIPPGYRVSYLPPSAEKMVSDLWGYKISYMATAKQITLTKEYKINTLYIHGKDFSTHNQMVNELKRLHKESVVLVSE